MKKKQSAVKRPKLADKDIMETCNVSPWYSVGKILPTSLKPKEDVFDSFRPNRQCVEYKISETWAKMQRGDFKVNVRETTATYEEIPPEICKPQRKKKLKLFSGGPPQWKFIDEIWKEQQEEYQKQLRKEHHKVVQQIHKKRNNAHQCDHEIVQRLVGPEWFMELSPKQLQAIDRLCQSICLDLRNGTIFNTQDILASLGLVLRPNQKQIARALKHSCGCPIEFLLVLYQIIDPKRKSYSLNDRLILSAVVHLGITQTLRELHVRIPSPPKVAEKIKKPKRKAKKTSYRSPYLEPQTFVPAPPKFSGIYKNKHKQYPESPYFSYLPCYELEKRLHGKDFGYPMHDDDEEQKTKITEYKDAQNFFDGLPGAKQQMLSLLPPTYLQLCPNLLHPTKKPSVEDRFISPNLCKATSSEPIICFCEENSKKRNPNPRPIKRSCCEKGAQKFLQSLCLCDDCLEKVAQKSLIRIHGGFQKSPCVCDDPVPVIQGTLLNKSCECYKEYRNKIFAAAARQYLVDQKYNFVVGGVVLTKSGPVYNLQTTLGEKICICGEIKQRKAQINNSKELLKNNKAKFSIGGIVMSKIGPVYNLINVVARKPCRCVVRYREKLKVLETQNELRKNPYRFLNNGLVITKQGPVFYLSNVVQQIESKTAAELHEVCSCEIKKPKCFKHCLDYVEYKVSRHTPVSSSKESKCTSENSSSETSESDSDETSSSELSDRKELKCPYCSQPVVTQKTKNIADSRNCQTAQKHSTCQDVSNTESKSSTEESEESESFSTNTSTGTSTSNTEKCKVVSTESGDYFAPKPCRCREELENFMKAKCPCEECNRKIRQSFATYIMGGTKTTDSGTKINVLQGIQQHLCGCMKDHLERIRKMDEYKSRVQARYNLKKQPEKYCISGVKNTPNGPVYIISGIRPPVDCECAKAHRETEENENFEKQRAKMPNTGRLKYEISGVKAMPDENVYIMSRALKVETCSCEKLLVRFEQAHRSCLKEYENYLKQTEVETAAFLNPSNDDLEEAMLNPDDFTSLPKNRSTLINVEDIDFENNKEPADNIPLNELKPVVPTIQEESEEEEEVNDSPVIEQSEPENTTVILKEPKNSKCKCSEESTSSEDETLSEDESSSSESSSSSPEDEVSECGSCHVENPPEVKPITLPTDKMLPESFVSKRFAIFRVFPCVRKTQMKVLRHILEGMAEDGFPLAKLPHVYKLPIFKLWLEMRCRVFWTYEDRLRYFDRSKYLWKHTFICYRQPEPERMPFTKEEARKMTWKQANLIRRIAAEKMNNYYRKLKQVTVDTGREFFAPTFSYEFPTCHWRNCAFAYLPAKEEDTFPYKIVQPHDKRVIPENKRMNCYC